MPHWFQLGGDGKKQRGGLIPHDQPGGLLGKFGSILAANSAYCAGFSDSADF